MQLADQVLARRYAAALYLSARAEKAEESAAAETAKAARTLSSVMAAFRHPRVSASDKKARLRRELDGAASERVLRFLDLLIDKKRFGLLPSVAADLQRLVDDGRGVAHASVRSARPLGELESKLLAERLGRFAGKKVVLDVKEDPELLAGAVARVGDWVLDGSLKGKLRALGARLAGS
ncbi:MAG: ATP synthase F1 subunit delta [Elusimicrobia bacterium]|nr:ATP synthase F1 subunit delta [Elusimicrobiota bacterium]